MSAASMAIRVVLLLMVAASAGAGIGCLPRRHQLKALVIALGLIVLVMSAGCSTLPVKACPYRHGGFLGFTYGAPADNDFPCHNTVRHQVVRR